jgi:cob(I)alamin adenosyltransferase
MATNRDSGGICTERASMVQLSAEAIMSAGVFLLLRGWTGMSLYSKTGDGGETSLADGTRVPKDDIRVAAYGGVDELNSLLGWCRAACGGLLAERIVEIQKQLFGLCTELASPPQSSSGWSHLAVGKDHCRHLESLIDEAQAATAPMTHFVLPGGVEAACRLHMARVCCRRAERGVVTLHRHSPVRTEIIIYLNRLSDLLYAWARLANQEAGYPEVIWGSNV